MRYSSFQWLARGLIRVLTTAGLFGTMIFCTSAAHAQRRGGGGGRMPSLGGGGMARPQMPTNMARPQMPNNMNFNRPNVSQLPNYNMGGNMNFGGNNSRPNVRVPNVNTPNFQGGMYDYASSLGNRRPTPGLGSGGNHTGGLNNSQIGSNLQGSLNNAGNRPNGSRPTTLPGNLGTGSFGTGGLGNGSLTRPAPLPGNIGNNKLPGTGNNNNINIGNNIGNRPTTLPGNVRPDFPNNNININRPNNNRPNNNWGNGNSWANGNSWGNGNWGISNNINNITNNININNNRPSWGTSGGWYGNGGNWNVDPGYNHWHGYHGNQLKPGWSGAYWGNWYHGSWGQHYYWHGYANGFASGWGWSAVYRPRYYYTAYSYMPLGWTVPVYNSWGINSLAYSWLSTSYVNPYLTASSVSPVIVTPAASTTSYDYSRPINIYMTTPKEDVAVSAQKIFETSRDRFKAGDYAKALSLADQALAELQNDPVIHEFRGLVLFALGKYDEAATVEYAVLSAGPGWDWSTVVGLYGNLDDYTKQLRALEETIRTRSNAPGLHFLLAYHYMVAGHRDLAAKRFAAVAKMLPEDQVSARLAKALESATDIKDNPEVGGTGAIAIDPKSQPNLSQDVSNEKPDTPPPPPPANLVGKWLAKPNDDVAISLQLNAQGTFVWAVRQQGRTESIEGQAGFEDNVLVLAQEQGPPLSGKIVLDTSGNTMKFLPPGAPGTDSGLNFTKQ